MSYRYISFLIALSVSTSFAVLSLYGLIYSGESDVTGPAQSMRSLGVSVRGMGDLIHAEVLPGSKHIEIEMEERAANMSNIKALTSMSSSGVHEVEDNFEGKFFWEHKHVVQKNILEKHMTEIDANMTGKTSAVDPRSDSILQGSRRQKKIRYLVHVCDSTRLCSGWGDRQRGLVSAFLLASVTGRKFLINMTSPCDIRKFLIPRQYNWDIGQLDPAVKSSVIVGGVSATAYHRMIHTQSLNDIYPHDVIYLRSNSDLLNIIKSNPHYKTKIPLWAIGQRWKSFKAGWDILMKPRAYIQEQVNRVLKHIDLNREGDLVCAHVRLGRNPSLPNDSPNRNSFESVQVLWRFLEKYVRNSSGVVITSDSMEVRRQARLLFGNKTLDSGGVISHIDRQRHGEEACQGFEAAILDQLLLRHCHVLVVSASNFSIRAAHLRGRRDKLFIFKNSKVVPFNMGS